MFLLCQHPSSIAEVKLLVKEVKFAELREIMMSPLSFGTAGSVKHSPSFQHFQLTVKS